MKSIKLLFYSLFISTILLTSCTNDDVNEVPDLQESESMQTALNHLINLYNDDGTVIENMNPSGNLIFDFCFEFVYPINLIYNNGAIITINSNEELIEVLINSTNQLFIVGIEFPFNVEIYNPETNEIELLTITNENEFANLLASCIFGDSCVCTTEYDPVCVEITENNQTIIITFPNACYAECEGFIEEDYFDCENNNDCDISELEIEVGECNLDNTYPLTINFEYTTNQEYFEVFVRDSVFVGYYELASLPLTLDNFQLSGYEYDYLKVCINDTSDCCEEIEWMAPNCDNGSNECDISNLQVEVGECNTDNTYELTINFEYENTNGQEYFDLYVRNDELLGYFQLSELPITIANFDLSSYEEDYIKICINDNLECCEDIEWLAPDCDTTGNDCYEYGFPINMEYNDTVVNVDSNEQVDYYLQLDYELVYPIELIINNETILVFQGILEGTYGERCD
tara:strand:- start:16599 stop:17972 length:1374 start_codon:yes stop_codon:yes gene_type:complete